MDLGVIADVASPIVALAAVAVAVFARLDSRKAAGAGEKSASAADRSAAASEKSAVTGEAAVQAAQRAADAAERATALQEQSLRLEMADRHDAAGPHFVPLEDAVVGPDLTARIRLRIDGGPGEIELQLQASSTSWCEGLSSTGAEPAGIILVVAHEPGDVLTVVAHLRSRPWAGDDAAILPVTVIAEAPAWSRPWVRRVSVRVVPQPPTPLPVPPDPDRPRLPEW